MSLPLKKCPSCKFWWFTREEYGCSKKEGRVTYPTTMQLEVEQNKIYCSDYRSRKMYDYLLQNKVKQTDRMIGNGDEGDIEDEKISKAKRLISIEKRKSKSKRSEYNFSINKPKRMIRKEF